MGCFYLEIYQIIFFCYLYFLNLHQTYYLSFYPIIFSYSFNLYPSFNQILLLASKKYKIFCWLPTKGLRRNSKLTLKRFQRISLRLKKMRCLLNPLFILVIPILKAQRQKRKVLIARIRMTGKIILISLSIKTVFIDRKGEHCSGKKKANKNS